MNKYIKFKSISGCIVYGHIIKVDKKEVTYIRESLTPWIVGKRIIEAGNTITETDYLNAVKINAKESGYTEPSDRQIRKALKLFRKDINVDYDEILKIFEGHLI